MKTYNYSEITAYRDFVLRNIKCEKDRDFWKGATIEQIETINDALENWPNGEYVESKKVRMKRMREMHILVQDLNEMVFDG